MGDICATFLLFPVLQAQWSQEPIPSVCPWQILFETTCFIRTGLENVHCYVLWFAEAILLPFLMSHHASMKTHSEALGVESRRNKKADDFPLHTCQGTNKRQRLRRAFRSLDNTKTRSPEAHFGHIRSRNCHKGQHHKR